MAIKTRTSGIMIPAYVAATAAAYQGPGDITTEANWRCWYSPARAFKAGLVTNAVQIRYTDATPATFLTKADGTVDYTGYDPASHGGGTPTVLILYDQTGNGYDLNVVSGTVSFIFSALNGFAGIQFNGASHLETTLTTLQGVPMGFSAVAMSTNSTAAGEGFFGNAAGNVFCGHGLGAVEVWLCYAGGAASEQNTGPGGTGVTLNKYHAGNFVLNGAGAGNADSYVDGLDSPKSADTGGSTFGNGAIWFGGSGAALLTGTIIEAGLYNGDYSGSVATVDTNQHSAYGSFP